jgi:hypothetical protein
MFKDHDQEMATLRQDLELAEKLILTQKEMIDCQAQQHQSASHSVAVGPVLPNFNDQNQPYYQPYYEPPRNQEFGIDPTALPHIDNYDCNIETSMDSSCSTQLVMTNSVSEFDQQTFKSSIPSILHAISAKQDVKVPGINEGFKRVSEKEGVKTNKKRRMK